MRAKRLRHTATFILGGSIVLAVMAGALTGRLTPAAASAASVSAGSAPLPTALRLGASTLRPDTAASTYACQQNLANGCLSLIADAQGNYCMSSYGSTSGVVREAACNANAANQQWYVLPSGANGSEEIWNEGSSCPAGASFDGSKCGNPSTKAKSGNPRYENYGYCVAIKSGTARENAELVMSECSNGQSSMNPANAPYFDPMSWTAAGPGPNDVAYFESSEDHAGTPDWYISTRGESRPGVPYLLQHATTANVDDIAFHGGAMGASDNPGSPSPPDPISVLGSE